jgi:ERCC4-type nuclease
VISATILLTSGGESKVLFIDSREPPTLRQLVRRAVEAPSQVITLDSGDYMMLDKDGCSMAIERKTWSDLLGSITDGRLFDQLARMDRDYHYSVLMIEGVLEITRAGAGRLGGRVLIGREESKYTHAFIQMTLLSLQRRLAVSVLHTPALPESIDLIRIIYDRGQRECYGISTRKERVSNRAKIRVKAGR